MPAINRVLWMGANVWKEGRIPVKPLLCLDLEGTLISNAVSQIPRPYLYYFIECAAQLCDLMIYTSVSAERVNAIRDLLVAEKSVPDLFRSLPVIRPEGHLKPKSACGRENSFLLDDQAQVVVPGEEDWWIPISEYLPPYSELDDSLLHVVVRIRELI